MRTNARRRVVTASLSLLALFASSLPAVAADEATDAPAIDAVDTAPSAEDLIDGLPLEVPPISDEDRIPVPVPVDDNGITDPEIVAPDPGKGATLDQIIGDEIAKPADGGATFDAYAPEPFVGTHFYVLFPEVVNEQKVDGSWVDVPVTISPQDKAFSIDAKTYDVAFPQALAEGSPVVLTTPTGSIASEVTRAKSADGLIEEDGTLRYTEAFPATDVIYAAAAGGYEEIVVLNDATADPAITWQIDTAGYTLEQTEDGAIALTGADGSVLQMPAPVVFDSAAPEPVYGAASYVLTPAAEGSYEIGIQVDPGFIAQATYPVFLDPGTSTPSLTADTFVNANQPNAGHGTDPDLKSGPQGTYRTFIRFGTAWQDTRQVIYDADLHIRNRSEGVPTNPVELDRATWDWQQGTTWNVMMNQANQGVSDTPNIAPQGGPEDAPWVLQLDKLYQDYTEGVYPDHGFRIMSPDSKVFDSAQGTVAPYLIVNYDTLPNGPVLDAPNDQAAFDSKNGITLRLNAIPPDADGDEVLVRYQVTNTQGSWGCGGSGQFCSSWVDEDTYNVPSSWLSDGGTFYWRVQSADICNQPTGLCDTTRPDGTNKPWNDSLERSFLVGLSNRGTDERYAMWSEALGNGMALSVNEANGNLVLQVPIDEVRTALGKLSLGFTYNSQAAAEGTDAQGFGEGWRLYAGPDSSGTQIPIEVQELNPAPYAGIRVTYASGRNDTFPWRAGNTWGAIAGEGTVAKTPGGSFSYVSDDGDSYAFDSDGKLTEARGSGTKPKATGNPAAFYRYTYATDGRLIEIEDPKNRTITFAWNNAPNYQLNTITNDWTGQIWDVDYVSDRLSTIQNPANETVGFTYAAQTGSAAPLLTQVKDGYQQYAGLNGWRVAYLNDTAPAGTRFDAVRVNMLAPPGGNLTPDSGKNWDLDYGSAGYFGFTSKTTTIEDPRGLASTQYFRRVVDFNDSGLPIQIVEPKTSTNLDSYLTTMVWNSNGQLVCSRTPAANAVDGLGCTASSTTDQQSTEHTYDPEAPFRLLETRHPTSVGGPARMVEDHGYDAGATFNGLWTSWFEDQNMAGVPDELGRLTTFNETWAGAPGGLAGANDWSLRLTGELTTQVDRYEFQVTGNDGYNLVIDNSVLLSCFYDDAPANGSTVNCGEPNPPSKKFNDTDHTITIELREETGDARLKVQWRKVGQSVWNTLVSGDVNINLGLRTDLHAEPAGGNPDLETTTTWAYAGEDAKATRKPSSKQVDGVWNASPLTRRTEFTYDDWGRWTLRTRFADDQFPQMTSRTFTDTATTSCLDVVTRHDAGVLSAGMVTDTNCNPHGDVTSITQTIRAVAGLGAQTRTTTTTYDAVGRPLTVSTPAAEGGQGPKVRTTYDRSGRPDTIETLLRGTGSNPGDWALTDIAYDDHPSGTNTPTMTETGPDPDGAGGLAPAVTVHTYDWVGNETKRTDANGKDWLTEYDAQNRVTKVTTPDPDAGASLTTLVTATTYALTGAEYSVTVTDPSGAKSKTWMDSLGRTVRTQSGETLASPPGTRDVAPTWTAYDSAGNAIRVQQSNLAIGASGNTIYSWRENVYDAFGDPRTMTEPVVLAGGAPVNATTTYSYDPQTGDLVSVDGPMPNGSARKDVVDYTWDRWRRLVSTTMWTNSSTDFVTDIVYNDASEQVKITSDLSADGTKRQQREFEYNPAGLIDAITEHHGTNTAAYLGGSPVQDVTTSYDYDQANRLVSIDSPRYTQTDELRFIYDDLGREILRYRETTSSTGSTCTATRADCIKTTYEIDGQVASLARTHLAIPGITYTWAHDSIGRDTALTPSTGTATTWSYYGSSSEGTLKGLLKNVVDPAGTTTYNYYTTTAGGPRGALRTVNDQGVSALTATYTYDAAGRVTKRSDGTLTIDRTYEAETGRVDTQHVWKTGSSPVRSFAWFNLGYDEAGNVTSRTERLWAGGSTVTTPPLETRTSDTGTGPWTYSYDGAGRMLSAVGPNPGGVNKTWSYTYDGQGNRLTETDGTTTETWTTDNQGWFKTLDVSGGTADDATYTFAPDGALDLVDVGTAGISVAGDLDLGYDSWGHTTTAQVQGTTVTNGIDALGRTVTRQEGSGTVTTLQYQGASEILAKLSAGTEHAFYSSTPGGPYARQIGDSGTAQLSIRDLHGDQVGEIAKSTNALTSKTWYSPFGESTPLLSGTLPASGLGLGFQGQLTDPDSTTVDMTTRQYLPSLGRFTTRDVLQGDPADPTSLNQFVYASGNPVTMWDPAGLDECAAHRDCDAGTNADHGQWDDDAENETTTSPQGASNVSEENEISVPDRRDIVEDFFEKYGCNGGCTGNDLGLGNALRDFMRWEDQSGRLSGSEWWRIVNGRLILDIAAAMGYLSGDRARVTKRAMLWVQYAQAAVSNSPSAQDLFWRAHQVSLHSGVRDARPYFAQEDPSERGVIHAAILNVDIAALRGLPSFGTAATMLGVGTAAAYPSTYPATEGASRVMRWASAGFSGPHILGAEAQGYPGAFAGPTYWWTI
jgi:RHS repeat-associated protein